MTNRPLSAQALILTMAMLIIKTKYSTTSPTQEQVLA